MSTWVRQYYRSLLILILCFSFFTRVWRLDQPPRYIFDEVYHAVTSKLMARDDQRAFEWWNSEPEPNTAVDWLHPPLAKYTQATSILFFGENSLGWRFSSAIFGVLVVFMVAKLSQELFENEAISLLAALFASLDGLLLTMSRIAMNDIHVTFFILLTLYFYVKHLKLRNKNLGLINNYFWLTGLSAGLAMGTKWSGVFVLGFVWLVELIYILKSIIGEKLNWLHQNYKSLLLYPIALLIIPILIYIGSYWQMFAQGKSLFCHQQQQIQGVCYYEKFYFSNERKDANEPVFEGYISHFAELHRQIWIYQTGLEATHGYQSRPYQWFLNIKPVWFHVDYQGNLRGDIYALGNPALQWLGVISVIFATLLMLKSWKKKFVDQSKISFLLTSYFFVWIFWQFSPRIMFYYHYTPATALLCIILAWVLVGIYQNGILGSKRLGQNLSLVLMVTVALTFFAWYPHWTGINVPISIKQHLYFALRSWK